MSSRFSTGSRGIRSMRLLPARTGQTCRSLPSRTPSRPLCLLPRPLPRTNEDPPYSSHPARQPSQLASLSACLSACLLRQRTASTTMTERSTYRASAILTCDNPGPAGAESKVSRSASGDLSLTLYPTEHMRAISSFPNGARARHNFRPGDEGTFHLTLSRYPLSLSLCLFLAWILHRVLSGTDSSTNGAKVA